MEYMEEDNLREEILTSGKNIIANVTVDGVVYYIDANREVYENVGGTLYPVHKDEIKEAVRKIFFKKSDNFML